MVLRVDVATNGMLAEDAYTIGNADAENIVAIDLDAPDDESQSSENVKLIPAPLLPPSNQAPNADAGGPYSGDEGSLVQLVGSSSSDPDGDALSYYWDLDNDGLYDDSTQMNPTKSWNLDGIYTVGLLVNDGALSDTDTATVNVANSAPEIYSSSYVYTLTQGNFSTTIPAVEKPQTAASFYNYYSWSSHTGFEKIFESKVFLYRDINTNAVSLFITHDIDNSPFLWKRVDFDLSGVPAGAYVAQSDDPNDPWNWPRTQEFSLAYPAMEGSWQHTTNTDGGILAGLPTTSSWAITIDPLYWQNINSWFYHYATGTGIALNMNIPITIAYQAQTKNTTVQTDEGTGITLGAFARDKGTDDTILNYHIDWNDPNNPGANSSGTTAWDTLFTFSYTYYDNGTFLPILTVTDNDGDSDTLNFTVLVNNTAPVVDAGSNMVVDEGTVLNFSGTFSDPGAYDTHTAAWDWDDGYTSPGSVSQENTPPDATGTVTGSHIFLDDGVYYPELDVTDDDGDTGQDSLTVTVNDLGPAAAFSWSPQPQDEGYPVQFTDLTVSYPDNITAWSWDFGGIASSAVQSPQYTFMDNGIYTITLKVTDDDGSTDTVWQNITVTDRAPVADFSWSPVPQGEGSPVQFTDLTTSYPDAIVSRVWGFGDGGSSNLTNPSHTYADNGAYPANLRVTDDDGSIDSVSHLVTIYNVAPIVNAGNNQTINEGTTASFSGSFTDPGLLDTHTYVWDFGDGTTSSSSLTPSHTYGDDGNFKATLTVTDNDGGVGIGTIFIAVNNVAPSVFTGGGPFTISENTNINLSALATDPGSDDLTFSWNFELGPTKNNLYYNNGVSPDLSPSPNLSPMNISDLVSHTYGDNGVFNVTLTVNDDDGGSNSVTIKVTVNNIAPSIVYIDAYQMVNFTLRVAGEKWHTVGIHLYEDNNEIWTANVTRYPGNPDNQSATISNVKIALNKSYTAIIDYIPNDPKVNGNVWGGNPVWVDMDFEDGGFKRLHHTFNVRQSDWDCDHWNHIDPWEVDLTPHLADQNITFKAMATDPGSDDLIFDWDFGDGNTSNQNFYYNDGFNPDAPKSPEVNPMKATDITSYKYSTYSTSSTYTVTLTVKDDDGASIQRTLILTITVI
jgi:PKD repeat protein